MPSNNLLTDIDYDYPNASDVDTSESTLDMFAEEVEESDESKVKSALRKYMQGSVGNSISDTISSDRADALKIYFSKPYGNEAPGRSQFVTSDVRDTVNWLLPSLLNVFLSTPNVVEFVPSNGTPEAIAEAQQQTDYINYLFTEELNGYELMYVWFWDALVTKNGFVKWYYKDEVRVHKEMYTGVSSMPLAKLVDMPDVRIISYEQTGQTEVPTQQDDGMGNMVPSVEQQPTYSITLERRETDGRIVVENVAPEKILIHEKATSFKDAKFVGIVYSKTKSDLLADGFTEEEIKDLPKSSDTENNEMSYARGDVNDELSVKSDIEYYEIIECYAYVDLNGDGIDELWRFIVCDREAMHILSQEEVDEIPMATISPFIKPYSFFGTSITDNVKDLQLINTTLYRTTLDYGYTVVSPQWEIVDRNLVDKADVQKRIPGGIVRTRSIGSIQPIAIPPFPAEIMMLMDKVKSTKDERTGVTSFNSGLNSDALNSNVTSTAGLEMGANGRQIQDMIARTFAETGIKDLFNGLRGLATKHVDSKKVIRLRGHFEEIDPTTWRSPVRVSVNVGLGTGTAKNKINDLQQLLALQLQFMPQQCATPLNIYNTLGKIVNTMGFKDTDTYVTNPSTVPPPPQGPTPEEVALKQIETELQKEQMRTDRDKYKTDVQAEFDMTKLHVDTALKQEALALKYNEDKSTLGSTDYFPGVSDR